IAESALSPFAMWSAFPTSDYYGLSAPTPLVSVGDGPSLPTTHGIRGQQGPAAGFPRSLFNRLTGSVPSFTPASSP
ncbi:hypothetical protein, partial [Brevibacterium sp. FME17]|uniref:hypothetical protein n=1 Tax=Brevibacterium sp. FME17 TaxID=2742606 RepID=UPI001D023F4B